MALFATSAFGNKYSRNDGGAALTMPTGDYTICCWVKHNGAYSVRTTIFQMESASDYTFGTTNAGVLSVVVAGAAVVSAGTVTADVWKFVALTHASTTFELWLGDLTTSATSQGSATNAKVAEGSTLLIFADDFNGFFLDGAIAFPRMWNVALTSGELNSERTSATLVKTANRWADWNFSAPTATINDNGNSIRAITRAGAISRTEDPFIPTVIAARADRRAFSKYSMVDPLISGRLF